MPVRVTTLSSTTILMLSRCERRYLKLPNCRRFFAAFLPELITAIYLRLYISIKRARAMSYDDQTNDKGEWKR